MPATRLVLEIERIHPEGALKPADDKQPGNFLVAFGRDANGRPAKAFFTGSRAHKLQADMLAHLDGSDDLKGRRLTIDVTGEWKTDRDPRKRGGEVVKDAATGKPIYDRHFETNNTASFLEGPLLELFRIRRAAKVHGYQADKLVQEGKKDEAFALLRGFADELGRLHRAAPSSKTEEMRSVVAAATEGTTNEPIGNEEAPDVASPSTAPLGGEAELQIVGDETSAGIVPTDAALAASRGGSIDQRVDDGESTQAAASSDTDPEAAAAARLAKAGLDFVDSPKNLPYPVTEEGLKAVAEIYKEETAAVASQPETPPPTPPAEKPVPQPASPTPAARVAAPRLPPRVVRPPLPIRRP